MSNASAKSSEVSHLRKKYIEQGIIVPAKERDETSLSKVSAKSSEVSQSRKKHIEQDIISVKKGDETNRGGRRDPSRQAHYYFSQALVHQRSREYDKARDLFEQAIETFPKRIFFDTYAGMEKDLKQTERARNIFIRAIKALPQDGMLYESYAMLERRDNRLREAADILYEGLKEAPNHKALHRCLAQVLMAMDDDSVLGEADRHFELARKFGVGVDERVYQPYQKLKVLRGPLRGHNTFEFLREAGFEITNIYVHNNGFATDFIVKSLQPEYQDSYDLTAEIFVRCFYQDTISYQDIRGAIKRVQSDNSRYHLSQDVLFLVLAAADQVRDYLYQLLEKPEQSPTVVPLEETDIRRAIESGDSQETLQGILDQWLHQRNLYKENYPVSGRRFFGREEELATLIRNIDSGNHTGMFGLRRIGKTSLLKQLREKRPQDLVVYIDLQTIPAGVKDCTYLYWNISNELKIELSKKHPQVAQNLSFSLVGKFHSYDSLPSPKEVAIAYDSDLHVIRNALTQLRNGNQVKVLLLLDELEQMLPHSSQAGWTGYIDFFKYLRGVSQQTGFVISVITAANPAICEEPHLDGQDNPVFQFYQEMYLPPFEQHECFEMVEKLGKGMGIIYSESSLEKIYQETGGHPFVTRQLCSCLTTQLFPERPLKVDNTKVEKATEEFFLHDTSIFQEILARLERDFPQEKDLLLFIADGVNNITELSQLCQTSVGNALGHLIGYQLIVREGTTYRIKMDLLLKWIRRHWLNVED